MAKVDYSGALLKIERAKVHLSELDYGIFTYLRQRAYRISVVQDFGMDRAGFEIALKQRPPAHWALPLGDAIHNLHAALDYIISALAIANGRSANDTAFPFGHDAADFAKRLHAKGRKAGDVAMALCADLKPYPQGNDSLVALHKLDLIDKHRLLLAVAATGHFRGRYFKHLGQPEISIAEQVYFLEEEAQFIPSPPGQEGKVPFEIGFTVDVVFPPDAPLAGIPCVAALNELVNMVAEIVRIFQQKCP